MSKLRKFIVGCAVVILTAILVTGCDGATKQSSPDPTSDQIKMVAPREVVGMPAGFRNVAEACDDGGNMILVTSRGSDFAGGPNGGGLGSGIAVILKDPRCAK